MNKLRKSKRIFCLGLAFTMAAYTSIMAAVTTPPASSGTQTGLTGGQTQGPGTGNGSGAGTGTGTGNGAGAGTGTGTGAGAGAGTGNGTGTGTGTGTGAGTAQQTGSSSPSRLPAVTAVITTNQAAAGSGATAVGAVEKPVVQSQGAVLYDATHNQFLFEQNADTRYFPASITKLMTALLVLENTSLDDMVTFSQTAVTNLESGAVTLKVKAGDKLSVRDCLYGLLLKSANEIANGLAEHVAGSVDAFAVMMNQKAASLGCTNTNFVNPNGLNNPNHVSTARDMALIAKAAFDNPTLIQIAGALSYDFPATASVPQVRKLTMGHKMLNPANAEYYQGAVGGKTGYTSLAGNTLVTAAERDGVRLIAVTLKGKQSHYQDTKALLDYGFAVVMTGGAGGTGTGSDGTGSAGTGSTGPGGAGTGSAGSGGMGSGTGTGTGTGSTGPGGAGTGGMVQNGNSWAQDSTGWRFIKADGSYAGNESMIINNEYYHFKDNQYMVTGWFQIDGIWYFFRPSGGMAVNRWVETNGMSYYVDANGSLFTGGTTPDGFKVDANGVWIP